MAGSTAVPIIVLLLATSMVGAQKKIKGKIDLVVIASLILTNSSSPDKTTPFTEMKNAYVKLAESFEAGADKTRFAATAVTMFADSTDPVADKILLNLTHDIAAFKKTLLDWDPKIDTWSGGPWWPEDVYYTFDAINTLIFPDRNPRRGKIVVMIMSREFFTERETKALPELREKNVWLYVICRNISFFEGVDKDRFINIETVAGRTAKNSDRVFVIQSNTFAGTIGEAMDRVKDAMVRDLCGWKSMCRFDDKAKCKFDAWQVEAGTYRLYDKATCDPIKPSGTCTSDDCYNECDKGWPWLREPECGCGTVKGRRSGEYAPPNYQNCPNFIVCPPCTTVAPVRDTTLVIILVVVGVAILVVAVGVGVGIYFYIKKRNAKDKVAEAKMDAMMETMRHMSIRVVQPGAEAGLAADLTSERVSKMVPGGPKEPSRVKSETGGAKKTHSIKSGGKSGPLKK